MEVRKRKKQEETKQRKIDPGLLDELIKQYEKPEQAAGPGGLLEQLTQQVYERILGGEMSHYLGYEKGQAPKLEAGQERSNYHNGNSKKTLINEAGQELEIEIPRDRAGEFEAQFIPKGQKRFGE
jgi:putative transposase